MEMRLDGATLAAYTAPRSPDVNYTIVKLMRNVSQKDRGCHRMRQCIIMTSDVLNYYTYLAGAQLIVVIAAADVTAATVVVGYSNHNLSSVRANMAITSVSNVAMFGAGETNIDIFDSVSSFWSTASVAIRRSTPDFAKQCLKRISMDECFPRRQQDNSRNSNIFCD